MNFMGGGQRAVKNIKKDENQNAEKDQIYSYIQKKINEKITLDSHGQSLFKANDANIVQESQDFIKANIIDKLCAEKTDEPKWIRHVFIENPQIIAKKEIKRENPKFKQKSNVKQSWSNKKTRTRIISPLVRKCPVRDERQSLTEEWIKKVPPVKGARSYTRIYV
ncbi:uncharacterized protein LOC107361258 [Tetranychus urticae]|uniref:Uncharacterized protein n=1 Tax=Tetranychus urticae TaxID=32264 RepID=T1K773_TETUR|nr:uncharacterized protein LOC107361258 [Tetranychus urticae]